MRRRIILSVAAILAAFAAHSQNLMETEIADLTMELTKEGYLNVDIDMDLSKMDIRTTQVVVLTPSIINGKDTLMLKSVGVYGRNRRLFYLRNENIKPTDGSDLDLTPSQTGDIIRYDASVPFEDWMDGCRLELIRKDFGCCNQSDSFASVELVERFPLDPYYPELIYLRPQSEVVKTREISGSSYVDFPVSTTAINPTYRNNAAELAKITGTIDSVKLDDDITIKSVSIKGYASPESPYKNNAYLAQGRTEALKDYVESLYHFGEGFIRTEFEAEDWDGLEKYVASSSLTHKEEILEAIHSDRDPDNKEWYIRKNWPDEYRHLLENCYPALRHSDYSIEYEIRSYSTPAEIEPVMRTAPQNLSLEEFYILAQTYEPGSDEFNELFETAVRMYPSDPAANLNAANSAIIRGDYSRALRYLDKAGDLPEAHFARGALYVYMEDHEAAKPHLEEAMKAGIDVAETVLKEISKNRFVYKKSNIK